MPNRHIETVWIAQAFLDDFILIYPVYALMMLDAGISGLELSLLFAVWSLSSLIFEIPSGVIGDLVNRRRYVALGSLIRAIGFLCWLAFPSLIGFGAGFVLWSLGSAIHSGTLQALLHDVLAEQGRDAAFAKIYGRGKSAGSAGVLCAMAIGGFLAEEGFAAALFLSALAPVLAAGLIVGYVTEPPRTATEDGSSPALSAAGVAATFTGALGAIAGNRVLALVAVMLIVFMGGGGVIDEYLGPLFEESGVVNLGIIGLLYGAVLGSRAIGTALAHRLRALSLSGIGALCLAAHGLLLAGLAGSLLWLVLACSVYFALMGVVEVLLETSLQEQIDVGARATVTSVAGAGLEVWGIALFVLIGSGADAGWGHAIGTAILTVLVLAAVLVYAAGPVAARIRS
jgi:MFS family permease